MTDLRTEPPPPPSNGSGVSGTEAAPDPLARLHKMSTTAGISSQDYVAINIPSILATLLGLASLLAPLDPVLLLIPLAAIICGVVALSQIKGSNGTQTGRGFAITGIILGVLTGGWVVVRETLERSGARGDQRELAAMIQTFGQRLGAEDYAGAYAMFSDRFRERVPLEAFTATWKRTRVRDTPVSAAEWNNVPMVFERDGARNPVVTAMGVFHFGDQPDVGRWALVFRKAGDQWVIDDIPSLFAPPDPRRR